MRELNFTIIIKNLFVLLAPLLLLPGCTGSPVKVTEVSSGADAAFHFVYSEYLHETSKDSHSHRTSYALKNGRLVYDYAAIGHPGPDKRHRELTVNHAAVDAIRKKLRELQLYTNHARSFPVEKRGATVHTGRMLCLTDGDRSYKITVAGGRPRDMKDRVGDRLSEFRSFIEKYFSK
ncbi:MAG: hypothetical protein JXA20_20545 [Spirochaetes bacterium]|nr:hypothetical protein [Spirochaetota bacterium]